jgi:hypothetical protein
VARRILLALSHSIEEYDQLRLLHELGHEVASLGGYIDPAHPHDDKRPALPQVPLVPAVKAAVDALGTQDNLTAAQEHIPDAALDWADTIIYHHYLHRLYGQWPRIRDWLRGDANRRVIWRTVGQSVDGNEVEARPFRSDGLEIVRYSPKERNIPNYAGEDALIRFYKDPDEWCGWTGETAAVANVTQQLVAREPYTNYGFWRAATEGLPTDPAGPGSERLGGRGALSYDEMRQYLREMRVYLYTGTQPASYTLGLIEAMMTGIPVVSIGPTWMRIFPYGPELFEGADIVPRWSDDPADARLAIQGMLNDRADATWLSGVTRHAAIAMFGIGKIREQWRAYLA